MGKDSINDDEEILNQVSNIIIETKTPNNSPRFLQGAYEWIYGNAESQQFNQAIKNLDKLVDFSLKAKYKAKKLIVNAKTPENLELMVAYLSAKGENGKELAKDAIEEYLGGKNLSQDKLNRCLMLAAKFGDEKLYDLAVEKGAEIYNDNKKLIVNETGKNILHYACQSDNASLVKKIDESMKEKNPFAIRDDANNSFRSINYIRPQHYISASLAEKLDHLYELDGNRGGSFTAMNRYYSNISKVLGQGLMSYLGDKFKVDEEAIRGSVYSGKYIGGMGVVQTYNNLLVTKGIVTAYIASGVMISAASIVSSSIIYAVKKVISNRRAEKLGLTPELVFDKNKQPKRKVLSIKYDNKNDNNHDLEAALRHFDFKKVNEIINNGSYKDVSSVLVKLVAETGYFPSQKVKEKFFRKISNRANPKNFEKLIYDLANRSKEDLSLAKNIIFNKINGSNNIEDLPKLKRISLMAAEFGDIKLLDAALAKLKEHGFTSLLSIEDEKGSNLMHYATRNGDNAKMIYHIEPRLSQEFKLSNQDKKDDYLLGIKIRKSAKNIFEISNKDQMKPKYTLRKETANELDKLYGIDITKQRGFSAYVSEDFRKKNRDHHGVKAGVVVGMTFLTGVIAVAIPPIITMASRFAQSIGAHGLYELPISGAIEAASTIVALEFTEKYIIPGLSEGINKTSNAFYTKLYNYDFDIEAFSSSVSDHTQKTILEMANRFKNLEKPSLKKVKEVMFSLSESDNPEIQKSLKIIIDNIIDKAVHSSEHETDIEKANHLIKAVKELAKNMKAAHVDHKQDILEDITVKFYQEIQSSKDFSQVIDLSDKYKKKLDILAELNPDESFKEQIKEIERNLKAVRGINLTENHQVNIKKINKKINKNLTPVMYKKLKASAFNLQGSVESKIIQERDLEKIRSDFKKHKLSVLEEDDRGAKVRKASFRDRYKQEKSRIPLSHKTIIIH